MLTACDVLHSAGVRNDVLCIQSEVKEVTIMVTSMFLAHLVGDYILQWDGLAMWKAREYKGVLAHTLVVGVVTWLFSLPFDTNFLPWVIFLWVTHVIVDMIPLWLKRTFGFQTKGTLEMTRYLLDQAAHITFILIALIGSGYVAMPSVVADVVTALQSNRMLAVALGYAFITMPAWILVEFIVYGFVNGTAPDFAQAAKDKYVCILERGLITTFVVLGQFMLVPLVTLPRLVFEGRRVAESNQSRLYVAELLASVTLAVLIGLALRQLF